MALRLGIWVDRRLVHPNKREQKRANWTPDSYINDRRINPSQALTLIDVAEEKCRRSNNSRRNRGHADVRTTCIFLASSNIECTSNFQRYGAFLWLSAKRKNHCFAKLASKCTL